MGELGAVRKRSRYDTGPHDSSPCVARVKILVLIMHLLAIHIVIIT